MLLLGACSDRDTKLAESMGAAEQSAMRAEKAAERAEEAANRAGAAAAPVVVEEDEEEATDEADKAIAEANEPPVNEPDGGN
jgi:alkanesulfonate monooxygenase SsuD/methylene tetrahydromethanopterin reductase-like flavin-dependent oxidoreductase (luciferase family)